MYEVINEIIKNGDLDTLIKTDIPARLNRIPTLTDLAIMHNQFKILKYLIMDFRLVKHL